MAEELYVGGARIEFQEARKFAELYFGSEGGAWSYPAYDSYPGYPGPAVGHADLLAVSLLNAHQKPVETYYGLESIMPLINERLTDRHLTGSLSEAGEETIGALAGLFGILDEHKPAQVGLTKLSKVLHRKRPELIPLYDKNIYACYVGEGRPLPVDDNRSWFNMAKLLLDAMKSDLESQLDPWREIAALAPGPAITPLRAMDIVGWFLGKQIRNGRYVGELSLRPTPKVR